MSFPFPGLAAVFTLGSLATSAVAQGDAAPSAPLVLTRAPEPIPALTALKGAYRVRLTSTWPQETTAPGCRNGGEEKLEGMLSRNANGNYTGTFSRRTKLLFCGGHGAHAGAGAASCALTLHGQGTVDVRGAVMVDEASPSGRAVWLTWTPAPGHEAAVSGACASAFKDAVKAMYLSTSHGAEFPLTSADAGLWRERLEDYAWEVELN